MGSGCSKVFFCCIPFGGSAERAKNLQPSGSHVSLKPLESGGAVSEAEAREQVDVSGVDLGIQEDSTATAQESAQVSENSTATAQENTETLPTYPQPKQTQSSVTELETLLAMEAQNQLQQLVATEKAQEDEKKSEQEQQELQKLEQQELQKLEQQELQKLEQQELQKLEQQELKKLEQQELKKLEQKVAQQEQEIAQQELQKLEEQEVAQQELQNLEQSAVPIVDQKSDSLLVLIPNDDQSTDEFSSATSSASTLNSQSHPKPVSKSQTNLVPRSRRKKDRIARRKTLTSQPDLASIPRSSNKN